MAERFTADLAFILVALIVAALLGFIIGYLFRRIRKSKFLALQAEKEQLVTKQADLENQLGRVNLRLDDCSKQLKQCVEEKQGVIQTVFDADVAQKVLNTKVIQNDLKIVEGIGEKIAGILQNRGINTWFELSRTSPDKIREILLSDGGPSYKIHEPATWPEQALLAHEGKWTQLKDLQEKLTAGRQN